MHCVWIHNCSLLDNIVKVPLHFFATKFHEHNIKAREGLKRPNEIEMVIFFLQYLLIEKLVLEGHRKEVLA